MSDDMNNLVGWLARPAVILILGGVVSSGTYLVTMKVLVPQMQAEIRENAVDIKAMSSAVAELKDREDDNEDDLNDHIRYSEEQMKVFVDAAKGFSDSQVKVLRGIDNNATELKYMREDISELKDEMKQLREDRAP